MPIDVGTTLLEHFSTQITMNAGYSQKFFYNEMM